MTARAIECSSNASFFILFILRPDGGSFSWPKHVTAFTFINKVFRRNGIILLLRHCSGYSFLICSPPFCFIRVLINVFVREHRALNIYMYIYVCIQCPIGRHRLFTAVCGVTDLRWLCLQTEGDCVYNVAIII